MAEDFVIEMEALSVPPRFHLRSGGNEDVEIAQIRVMELGSEEPSWFAAFDAGMAEDLVAMHILTFEEAQQPIVSLTREGEPSLEGLGVVVESFAYGEPPPRMRQYGSVKPLKTGWLYELTVVGAKVAQLRFSG